MAETVTKETTLSPTPKYWWEKNFTTYVAVTAVILAVCATLATFKAGGFSNMMVMSQSQASDQWAYYQAKSIKETAYQVQKDVMVIVASQQIDNKALIDQIEKYDKEISRYKQEKDEIMQEAKNLEKKRDFSQIQSIEIGKAVIMLQIGILLTSLAAINKTASFWFMGMGSGVIGIAMFVLAMMKSM
mgnify:CR=1 FL=1